MTCVGWARRCAVGILLCAGLSGCFPGADTQVDEQKEPHFMRGMNLVNQMDYTGAIEEFEKALEENPRNASARFELGWLYEDKANDPAAAIYHYDRYLKFSTTQDKADLVKQHITSCKLELTKSVSTVGTQPSGAQRELDRISSENRDLRTQITNLQAQLALAKNTPVPVPHGQTSVVLPPSQPNPNTGTPVPETPHTNPTPHPTPASHPTVDDHNPGGRVGWPTPLPPHKPTSYVIKQGDTFASISRKCGVSADAIMAANPKVKPSHMLVGQTLKIPAP